MLREHYKNTDPCRREIEAYKQIYFFRVIEKGNNSIPREKNFEQHSQREESRKQIKVKESFSPVIFSREDIVRRTVSRVE